MLMLYQEWSVTTGYDMDLPLNTELIVLPEVPFALSINGFGMVVNTRIFRLLANTAARRHGWIDELTDIDKLIYLPTRMFIQDDTTNVQSLRLRNRSNHCLRVVTCQRGLA